MMIDAGATLIDIDVSAEERVALPLGAVRLRRDDPALDRRVLPILDGDKGFVLLTVGADEAVRAPPALVAAETRHLQIVRVRAASGLGVNAFLTACCRVLGIAPATESRAEMHRAILSKLARQQRARARVILLVEDAGALADEVLKQIHHLFRLGDRWLLPAVLVAAPDFAERLKRPSLGFLRAAIAAHFRLDPQVR
jgi:type II secretory pathway predicted ATPase ExeA